MGRGREAGERKKEEEKKTLLPLFIMAQPA